MFHTCRHIKTNGLRCQGAALRDKPFCYFHAKLHFIHHPDRDSRKLELPAVEDSSSLLLAASQVIRYLESPTADLRRAGLLLHAIQVATQLAKLSQGGLSSGCVRQLYDRSGASIEPLVALEQGSEVLAPDEIQCEPPNDCRSCRHKKTCVDYEEPDEEETDSSDYDPRDTASHSGDAKKKDAAPSSKDTTSGTPGVGISAAAAHPARDSVATNSARSKLAGPRNPRTTSTARDKEDLKQMLSLAQFLHQSLRT